jgi:GH15 family glucan-1,4-alpha-glucosidase
MSDRYTIHGGKEAPEEELTHLAGHKDSKPVRIGNGAVDHLQLDIYGELMDSIYLAQSASSLSFCTAEARH